MRVIRDPEGHATGLVLSRRNLRTMLAKLDGFPEDSARTLLAPSSEGFFTLAAEEDDEHYNHADRADEARGEHGRMHWETEAVLNRED